MIWTGTIRNFGRLAKGELTRDWSKQDGFNQPWEPCYQIFGIIIRFNHKICSQPWSYSFVESPPFALLCFQSEWKMAHLILVSNMIDRDAAFSLKRLDGSGPFSGLTQLHANYFFLSNLFCGFFLLSHSDMSSLFWFDLFLYPLKLWKGSVCIGWMWFFLFWFDLFYILWNCEKARFELVGCEFFIWLELPRCTWSQAHSIILKEKYFQEEKCDQQQDHKMITII